MIVGVVLICIIVQLFLRMSAGRNFVTFTHYELTSFSRLVKRIKKTPYAIAGATKKTTPQHC
jgi:hypothetical protein